VIPAGFIQDLLSRIDVAEVVGRHVELKKAGINLKGLCPFHGEKTPSFIVSPSRQTYHCFGCGAHGDALRFLMERNGLGFVDAVHDLAQQAGMQVPEDDTSPAERERAADAKARQATLTEVLAARFGLGYAPGGWHALASAFARYDDPLLVDAGLVIVQGEDDDAAAQRRYDRFRDRVMFPIRSVQGEVIGFGGRVLDQGEPKYLNSPETPVFVKGRELYGLHEARQALRQHGFVLVVEGYMDVVGLAQLGFANAVATLGTACTADHVQKLFRFTDSVVFSFDGDAAGRRAAGRALEAALPHATDTRTIRFLFLPPEHDPDSYIREHGSEAFGQQIEQAVPLSRQLVEAAREGCDLATAEGRARCLAQARPLWQALPDGLLARQILGDLAQLAQLDSAELRALWQHESASPRGREAATAPPPPRPARPARRALATGTPTLLDRALWLLLARCELWNELPAAAHDRLASQPAPYGPAFAWLERHLNEHGAETAEALLAQMPADELGPQGPALQRRVAEFHDNDPGVDLAAQLGWVLDELELKMLKEEMDLLVESGLADPAMTARYRELQQRFADLKQKLAARA
jgi:DNA primase